MNCEAAAGPTVLVADRDSGVRAAACDVLATRGYAPLECASREGVEAAVHSRAPAVVLLAAELDREAGRSLLCEIKTDPELLATAVVVLARGATPAGVMQWLEIGADDVLVGEPTPAEIIARVHAANRRRELRLELLRRDAALEELAYTDELTGLPNRRFARRQLAALMSRARRHGSGLAVALIDADHFKAINDRFGHALGDRALRELATRLEERVRQEDVVARHGGEEFLVLLPDTTAAGAAVVAEALRSHVARRAFADEERRVALTVSVGWASWAGEDLDRLVERADSALYAAKVAGRNRVHPNPRTPVGSRFAV